MEHSLRTSRLSRLMVMVLIAGGILAVGSPAQAGPKDFNANFSSPPALYYTLFESGARIPHTQCGTDACASLGSAGGVDFLQISVHPSATPGYYTNVDVSQVDLEGNNLTNSGPYTATVGRPVTLTARIKWSANYDFDGVAGANGTSGIVLWNSPFDNAGDPPNFDYDQIGFTWVTSAAMGGLLAGFTGSTFVNQVPVGVDRPASPVNINDWITVTMVWTALPPPFVNQKVAYYVNGVLFGQQTLPVMLAGLSLEIWNDNQEPNPCPPQPLCIAYPNPSQTQSFYVDYVSVTQN